MSLGGGTIGKLQPVMVVPGYKNVASKYCTYMLRSYCTKHTVVEIFRTSRCATR